LIKVWTQMDDGIGTIILEPIEGARFPDGIQYITA
jgi:hypothetical protein